ncbi:putative endo-1-3(4)-beta-glucanase [Venturia nashicola]|uniref:Putative endo-1-3(4)-beta-glucanase n=1 Tax=Venturia nashicola TaxID=86259 RepID=A0A4Z1PTA0_9PEZI|nr:putative endo-1-3(4)-beta-glucanase [Venturia nashicola]TLD38160.1 putative endo-1-3(4)-beta-glucanase [Venturia nashicola]
MVESNEFEENCSQVKHFQSPGLRNLVHPPFSMIEIFRLLFRNTPEELGYIKTSIHYTIANQLPQSSSESSTVANNATASSDSCNDTINPRTLVNTSVDASTPRTSSYDRQIAQVQDEIRNCKEELEAIRARKDPLRDSFIKVGLMNQIPKSEKLLRKLLEKRQTEWDKADYDVVSKSFKKEPKCVMM